MDGLESIVELLDEQAASFTSISSRIAHVVGATVSCCFGGCGFGRCGVCSTAARPVAGRISDTLCVKARVGQGWQWAADPHRSWWQMGRCSRTGGRVPRTDVLITVDTAGGSLRETRPLRRLHQPICFRVEDDAAVATIPIAAGGRIGVAAVITVAVSDIQRIQASSPGMDQHCSRCLINRLFAVVVRDVLPDVLVLITVNTTQVFAIPTESVLVGLLSTPSAVPRNHRRFCKISSARSASLIVECTHALCSVD